MPGKDINSLFKDNKLTAITFATADASFAVPLEQVLYIEKDTKRNLQVNELDEFNHEVITFQNNTVQLFDFNKLIGSQNHHQTMKKLTSELDEFEQFHNDWMANLENALKKNTPFTLSSDPSKCAFGDWLVNYQTDNEELKETLLCLNEPHEKLHHFADRIKIANEKDHEEALKIFEQEHISITSNLNHLFQLSKERALSSVRPIILFVEHNDSKVTALRLDNINDIITFDESVFCSDDSVDGIMKDKKQDFMIEGFLRDGNNAPLMLMNCQPLAGQEAEKVA